MHNINVTSWTVGIDLRASGTGALHFARWLHERSAEAGRERELFHGAFVLEQRRALNLEHTSDLLELERQVEMAVSLAVKGAEAGAVFSSTKVLDGADAEDALTNYAAEHDARAIIIGRRAPTPERRLVRLGRVARRLCRRLPRPVVVVPPELRLADIGSGPVILATSLDRDADGAVAFARQLAASTGRKLVVTYVVPTGQESTMHIPMLAEAMSGQAGELDARRALEIWMKQHALSSDVIVASGDPVDRLIDIAQAEHSPMVVCGSRMLGVAPRALISSVGTAVAASSGCPTAIVPPLER